MRIAHVTDYYLPRLGGIEMQVHDLAVRQRAAGHDVTVVTQTPHHPGTLADPDPGWVERLDSVVSQRAVRPFVTGLNVGGTLSGDRFDVVHVHASLISPFAMLAARAVAQRGIPAVVTVHSLWTRVGPSPDIAWGLVVGHKRWPVVWSAVSKTAARPVSRTLGGGAVAILPNGIDPDVWVIQPAARPPATVTIASVMRLSRRKRPMPLLRILRRLRDRVSPSIDLRAVIIGEGPSRATMLRYLEAHGMDSWVSLPGRLERSDIRDIFRRTDLYVAPAELESFGIAALEARSAGLPVIASRHGGVGEFISDGDEGFLTGSDDEMVHALAALAVDSRTREKIAAHNRSVPPAVSWARVLDGADVLYAAARLRADSQRRHRTARTARSGGGLVTRFDA